MEQDRYIYMMLSRTQSSVSKWIQRNTHCEYSHSALSLDRGLTKMYSFARRRPHNVLIAGFIHENLDAGVYSWNTNAPCILYRFRVTEEVYQRVKTMIAEFMAHYRRHKYNIVGLFYIHKNKVLERKYKYACSQFVSKVLLECGVVENIPKNIWLMQPDDLRDIEGSEVVFKGELGHVRDNID